jgi:hypothetical protein
MDITLTDRFNFLSMGSECSAAAAIRGLGFRTASYPFDWIRSLNLIPILACLSDNLARFQIIVKGAFLPLSDKRIKKLFDEDKTWYTNKMLSSLIQACGRGVRSNKDHCVTYILDAAIVENIVKYKHKIPKYFLDRFV